MVTFDFLPADSVQGALAAVAEAVDRLAALTDPAAPSRVEGAEAASVVTGALALAGRLSAVAAGAIPVVEADGWWALEGARSVTSWVAASGRLSHGQAARLVALGRALRDDLPVTAVDAVSGAVSIEAAHVLAAVANTPSRKAALAATAQDCGEGFLVEHARELTVGQLRILARRWAAHADPESDERGYREASEREFLDLANTTDGWHLSGFLTTDHGHALTAALDALAGRSADQAGQPAGRRRANALNNVVRTVLDSDLTGSTGDHRPQITVVTDPATLTRAVGRDESDRPVTRQAASSALAPDVDAEEGAMRAADPVASGMRDAPASDVAAPRGCAGESPPGLFDESHDAVLPSVVVEYMGDRAGPLEVTADRSGSPGAVGGEVGVDVADRRGHSVAESVRGDGVSFADVANGGGDSVVEIERFAVAELVGTGPIPDSVLARLACDSQITRVVFGPDSVVLNVGRAERTYTGAKRRAIIARDERCRFPGCSAPPGMSEVHHTEHWLRDHGETDVRTGVLTCWYHHALIHERAIEVRRGADGRWTFRDRRGRELVGPIG
ncbi:DUF222 domain-containing protein [Cellulomonas sp. McL0617]|uniref:HNH endonuclease signature motif containing protein n=1 Tax=Cellulomonas sp. McL0617 TaxID=3415675 RepID=UPI003CEF3B14